MLWLALHFPQLPLEIFTRASTAPEALAVSEGEGREQRLLCVSPVAVRHGTAPGMRLSAALALSRELRVLKRDALAERSALERLAAWAGQYSSLVHLVAPHTLLLEVGGSVRLYHGLENLLTQIEIGIAGLGFSAQSAVAPTRLAATWLARAGGAPVVDASRLPGVLGKLPLDVLDLAPDLLKRLAGMGVTQIGDCLRLPRDGLAKRLGPELVSVLDRALGNLPDPRESYSPPPQFSARLELPMPVDNVEALVFALNRLVVELCGDLRARGAGVMSVRITFKHPAAPDTNIDVGLVAPARDAKHLTELIRERLARTALPEAVESLALNAADYLSMGMSTRDFFATQDTPEENAQVLIDRLRARLGEGAVKGLCVIAEHRPERAFGFGRPKEPAKLLARAERPLWLLPDPVPLKLRADQPCIGSELTLQGEAERIESGWWDEGDIGRDYFVARNGEGECYWVYRELKAPQRWWLHGVFG